MCAIYPSQESPSGILDAPAAKWDPAATRSTAIQDYNGPLGLITGTVSTLDIVILHAVIIDGMS